MGISGGNHSPDPLSYPLPAPARQEGCRAIELNVSIESSAPVSAVVFTSRQPGTTNRAIPPLQPIQLEAVALYRSGLRQQVVQAPLVTDQESPNSVCVSQSGNGF